MDCTIRSVFRANSRFVHVLSVRFYAWPRVCTVLCETPKETVNLSVHQDGGHICTGILEILDTEPSIAEN
jgi:hypothetical protein